MTTELEQTLARELTEVADGIRVPPMPSVVPADEPRPRTTRLWQPLLVAAAVALVVGIAALEVSQQNDGEPQPTPSPTSTPSTTGSIRVTAPTVPYVIDQRLYINARQVPGDWWFVESRGGVWLAQQTDGSWWWGGPGIDEAMSIEAQLEQPPVLSPNGRYAAFIDVSDGTARLTGFDTQPAGEGFGLAPVDLPSSEDGIPIRVRAVTDDGDVIVQGTRTSRMWRAQFEDQQTVVDLAETAPGQVVLQGTSAGLVVVDGADGATDASSTESYLATISGDGVLTPGDTLPTYDALELNPGGTWLVRSPAGTLGGEVASVSSLSAQEVGADKEVVLDAPEGWGFANGTWTWEDDETLVAVVLPEAEGTDAQLVRCSVSLEACRAFPAPSEGDATGAFSAEEALDAMVEAVVAGDRAGLADPAAVDDARWDQLLGYAADGGGSGSTCRDNGGGTMDCEIVFEADPDTTYYAILGPANGDYGWQITHAGIAHD
jgi:hypothetical protein